MGTNDTKTKPEKQKIYNGYGHWHTTQIQKTVENPTMQKPMASSKWHELRIRKTTDLRWPWPQTHKANPEDRRSPNIWKPMYTKKWHENRTRKPKDLRWLWPPIHKQIQKTLEIQTVTNLRTPTHDTKPETWKQEVYVGHGHRHTKPTQKPVEIQTFTNLWTPKNDTISEQEKQQI